MWAHWGLVVLPKRTDFKIECGVGIVASAVSSKSVSVMNTSDDTAEVTHQRPSEIAREDRLEYLFDETCRNDSFECHIKLRHDYHMDRYCMYIEITM